jgi:hypothetical protein
MVWISGLVLSNFYSFIVYSAVVLFEGKEGGCKWLGILQALFDWAWYLSSHEKSFRVL